MCVTGEHHHCQQWLLLLKEVATIVGTLIGIRESGICAVWEVGEMIGVEEHGDKKGQKKGVFHLSFSRGSCNTLKNVTFYLLILLNFVNLEHKSIRVNYAETKT